MVTHSERGWARSSLVVLDRPFRRRIFLPGMTKPGAYESTLSGRLRGRETLDRQIENHYYISRCRGIPLMVRPITRYRPRRLELCVHRDAKSQSN
jgi:hypothetical protein